ncbi:tetratricopeptide repeat protein [Pseudonocardia xishanensis]|uniref:Tetratricopeptide repeat protein n=1 Tax=Pseudonocardia xishanensis TaxID=630995 RepID=A0ABP8RSW0_9PSEU
MTQDGGARLVLRVDAPVGDALQIGELAVPLGPRRPGGPPPRPGPLLGRERELGRIVRAVEGSAGTVLITGRPGSGRTATAVGAAHRLAPLFPDGVLVERLADTPVPATELAVRVLRLLGVRVPPEPLAAARTVLTERRVLLVLDDVADAAARSLVPPGARSFLLLTGRSALDLPRIRLGDLGPVDARTLLGASGPGTAELVAACAGLPLALRLAALRLRAGTTPAALAADLARPHRVLAELRVGDRSLRASLAAAAAALSPTARALLRGLGAFPLVEATPATAALAAGLEPESAAAALAELVDAHLVDRRATGRFAPHPLVRRYAEEDVRDRGGPREVAAAGDRIAHHYAVAMERADSAWWRVEWPNLGPVAAHLAGRDRGALDHLADATADRERTCAPWQAWLGVQQAALRHAQAEGPAERIATLQVRIGTAQHERGEPGAALVTLCGAAERYRAAGDPVGAADALRTEADVLRGLGAVDAATTAYRRVLGGLMQRADGEALRVSAWALHGLGSVDLARGESRRARRALRAAAERFRTLDDGPGVVATARALGDLHRSTGDHPAAVAAYRLALARTAADDRPEPAALLVDLGELLARLGERAEAVAVLDRGRRAAEDDPATRARARRSLAVLVQRSYQASSSQVVGRAAPSWPSSARTSSSVSNPVGPWSGSGWSELTGRPSEGGVTPP